MKALLLLLTLFSLCIISCDKEVSAPSASRTANLSDTTYQPDAPVFKTPQDSVDYYSKITIDRTP